MPLIGLAVVLALTFAPLAASSQAGKVYRIGYLSPRLGIESPEEASGGWARQG